MPGASAFGSGPDAWDPWLLFVEKIRRLLPATLEVSLGKQHRIKLTLGDFERFLELNSEFTDPECRALIAHAHMSEAQLLALLDHPRAGVRAGLLHNDHSALLFIMDSDHAANAVSRSLAEKMGAPS